MGQRGPVPKRKAELRGHRSRAELEGETVSSAPAGRGGGAKPPAEDPKWHRIAKKIWRAAKTSGMARYYEETDWAVLYSLMDDLSEYKQQARRSSQMLAAILAGLTALGLTEGDRRRMQIELARPDVEETTAGQAEVERWMQEFGGPVAV